MKVPTYEEIKPYIEKKLVSEQVHPQAPNLRIFNYTQSCQFAQAWDDVTRQCRGLIMDVVTGEVIARPFPKFFNYGEHVSKGWPIPASTPIVTEKLDGSLGILYVLNGEPWIATRGSFMSDQAQWATKWWRDNVGLLPQDGETHLYEIIYPENRIVVNYDYSGLVHLVTLDNETGRPIADGISANVRKARLHATRTLEELANDTHANEEGFVIYYPEENVRMKIKFPEYVRLHKLVTGINEIAIWEHLEEGKSLTELVEKVPDEFYKWIKEVVERLLNAYRDIEGQAFKDSISLALTVGDDATRKEKALYIQKECKYPGIMFAKLDDKPYDQIIWKMVRPHGAKVFKVDIDL